jgi:hypothetical protein
MMVILPGCGCGCDPQDPPPVPCVCPDFCAYAIEIVAPSVVAGKSPSPQGCTVPQAFYVLDEQQPLPFAIGGLPTEAAECPIGIRKTGYAANLGSELSAKSNFVIRYCPVASETSDEKETGDPPSGFSLSFFGGCSVRVTCESPKYRFLITKYAAVYIVFAGDTEWSRWSVELAATVYPDSYCSYNTRRVCDQDANGSSGYRYLFAPLQFTVTPTFPGLGSWGPASESGSGPRSQQAKDIAYQLLEQNSTTFRISSRGTCRPCSVLVDGEDVPLSEFDALDVIGVEWEGLSNPGYETVITDGVQTSQTGPSRSGASLAIITQAGCDSGSILESKGFTLAPGGYGTVNACVDAAAQEKHQRFTIEQINDDSCRISGGISTSKILTPCQVDGSPTSDTIYEESWWTWECVIVDGVPGAVTVSPNVGARYFNADPVVCDVTLTAPTVTLTFAP